MTTEQQVEFEFIAVSERGQPAPVEGDVEATISDTTVCTLERLSPTKFRVKGIFGSVTGQTPVPVQVVCIADADLGAGVVPIEASGVIEMVSPQAVSGTLVFGPPSLQL